MPRKNRGPCAYCSAEPAETSDHVIPRGCWGPDLPARLQLPTVPACVACNQSYSVDEEYFRLHVSSRLAYEHPVVKYGTWPGPIRRMLQKSPRLRAELISTAEPALLELPSGEVMDTVSIAYDPTRIGNVVEKMGRGAYYLDLRRPLPQESRIRTFVGVPPGLADLVAGCSELNLADGTVRVRRGYDDNEPCFMLISFQFYNDKVFTLLATTPTRFGPVGNARNHTESVVQRFSG